jgi:hypothetical protein
VFIVIVLALGALAFAELNQTEPSHADPIAAQALMPVASSTNAVSSAFFCAGGTAAANGQFDSTIVVANPNPNPITVTVTVYPAAAPGDTAGQAAVAALKPVTKSLPVGPATRAALRLGSVQQSPFAAALVETSSPDIAVEHETVGKTGLSSTPCASAASKTWFVPTGTTTKDAHELLAVFNPFAADAVLDVTFQTSDGFRSPGDLQGLPVPAGSLHIVDVTTEVPRVEQLATFVTARSGQVIVDRLQSFDGTDPNHGAGATATLAAPHAASVWSFAQGAVDDSLHETFTVVNPGDQRAQVQVEVALDDPQTNGVVDPIPVSVPAHGYAQVAMQDQTRVPKGIGHAVTVRSLAGPDVVVERVFDSTGSPGRVGYAPTLGAPLQATRWLFADGSSQPGASRESLAVLNPSDSATLQVSISLLANGQVTPIDGLQNLDVAPSGRLALDLGQHVSRPDVSVIATTTLPAVVERSFLVPPGLSFAMGMPMADSGSVPSSSQGPTTTSTTTPPPLPDSSSPPASSVSTN